MMNQFPFLNRTILFIVSIFRCVHLETFSTGIPHPTIQSLFLFLHYNPLFFFVLGVYAAIPSFSKSYSIFISPKTSTSSSFSKRFDDKTYCIILISFKSLGIKSFISSANFIHSFNNSFCLSPFSVKCNILNSTISSSLNHSLLSFLF